MPVAAAPPSAASPGDEIADIVSPRLTSCEVLEDGDMTAGLLAPLALRLDDQYFTRWMALSKLLYHG
jgi:hypothetical protein